MKWSIVIAEVNGAFQASTDDGSLCAWGSTPEQARDRIRAQCYRHLADQCDRDAGDMTQSVMTAVLFQTIKVARKALASMDTSELEYAKSLIDTVDPSVLANDAPTALDVIDYEPKSSMLPAERLTMLRAALEGGEGSALN